MIRCCNSLSEIRRNCGNANGIAVGVRIGNERRIDLFRRIVEKKIGCTRPSARLYNVGADQIRFFSRRRRRRSPNIAAWKPEYVQRRVSLKTCRCGRRVITHRINSNVTGFDFTRLPARHVEADCMFAPEQWI